MSNIDYFKAAMAARGKAIECTKEHAIHCLEVLPPVYASLFFGLGEPYSHEPGGVTRHWVMDSMHGCRCTFGTKTEAAAAFAAG
jgi:hypothetical protein